MSNVSIIYYTSNIEKPEFEDKIVKGILNASNGLPIISVSQKPMDFGTNICVGDVGYSYLNAFRQILLGCMVAKTDFVAMAESDCLYPKHGYFDYEPEDKNIVYSYNNVWILFKNEKLPFFYRKEQTHGSLIYGREYLIKLIKRSLSGLPMWSRKKVNFPLFTDETKFKEFCANDPIINVVTGANGRKGTELMKVNPRNKFNYWGRSSDLKVRLFK